MVDCFVGRQPILNRNNEVYGYELLYRAGSNNAVGDVDFDVATSQLVMNSFVEIGLENIVGHQLAFLNMTRQFLITPELLCFPPEQVVLEIPSDLSIDDEIRGAIYALKAKDYTIALDDFCSDSLHAPLLPIADVVKLDAHTMTDEQLDQEFRRCPGDEQLRTAHLRFNLVKITAQTVADAHRFAGSYLRFRSGERIADRPTLPGK